MWRHRADGTLAKHLNNTRRAMPYFMRGRNESAVYFEQDIGLRKTDAFIRAWNQANPMLRIDVFQLCVWALRDAFERHPGPNRFVAGGRLYDRKGIWFSYAVKQRLEEGTPLVVVKRRFDTDATFGQMVQGMHEEQAAVTAPGRKTVDKELGLLMALPGFVRRIAMAGVDAADRFGLLPRGYIENDPMYTSAFFANMASLGMPAVFHHLYEYGTASTFGSIGRPVTEPGSPTSGPDRRRTMTIRWTFDERTDDGLAAWYCLRRIKQVVEDPEAEGVVVETMAAGAAPAPVADPAAPALGPEAIEGASTP